MENIAELEKELIGRSAELLRGVVDGNSFDGIYFRLVTLAVEDFRDGKIESAARGMEFAKKERP
jgi:hypothetical protein